MLLKLRHLVFISLRSFFDTFNLQKICKFAMPDAHCVECSKKKFIKGYSCGLSKSLEVDIVVNHFAHNNLRKILIVFKSLSEIYSLKCLSSLVYYLDCDLKKCRFCQVLFQCGVFSFHKLLKLERCLYISHYIDQTN